jgi:hypothetical protein
MNTYFVEDVCFYILLKSALIRVYQTVLHQDKHSLSLYSIHIGIFIVIVLQESQNRILPDHSQESLIVIILFYQPVDKIRVSQSHLVSITCRYIQKGRLQCSVARSVLLEGKISLTKNSLKSQCKCYFELFMNV